MQATFNDNSCRALLQSHSLSRPGVLLILSCSGKGTSPTALEMSRKFSVPVGRTPKGGLMARPPSNQQVGQWVADTQGECLVFFLLKPHPQSATGCKL